MTVPKLTCWGMSKCDPGNMVPESNVKINNHQRSRTFNWKVVFGFISWWIVVSVSLGTFQKEVKRRKVYSKDIKTEPRAVWHKVQVTQQLCVFSFSLQFWIFKNIPLYVDCEQILEKERKNHFHNPRNLLEKNCILLNKLEIIPFFQGSFKDLLEHQCPMEILYIWAGMAFKNFSRNI